MSIFSSEKNRSFRAKILHTIESFSLAEKIMFYAFVGLFAASSLWLLSKANDEFIVEVPAPGGELKEGVVGYPLFINPLLSVTDSGRDLTRLVYSGLLKATPDGEFVNDIAESYIVSEDGLTYSVKIRDDAYFHDGEKVTAEDVDFTIRKAIDPVLKSNKAPAWQGVEVEVIDEKNIEFHLKKPYAPFVENLTLGILPKHIWGELGSDAFVYSKVNFEPIGSGPYRIANVSTNSAGLPEYYELESFNKYTGGAPFIKRIFLHVYPTEGKLVEAFKKGEINAVGNISSSALNEVKKVAEDSEEINSPLPRIYGVFFNENTSSVLADANVRKALDLAVNRQEIIDTALLGFGAPAYGPLPTVISSIPPRDFNLEKATEILENAGFKKNEKGIYEKTEKTGKKTLQFSISTTNAPDLKKTAELLQASWQKLGADVSLKIFDLSDLNQNVIRPRRYEALLFGEVIGRDLDLYAFWHSSERNDPGLNIAMYTNSKVDDILTKARQETSTAKKIELYKSFETEIIKDTPAVFLFSPRSVYILPDDVKGVNLDGITSSSERFLEVNKWYIETEKVWKFFIKD